MLRVLIVDDEPHAHDVLAHHCRLDPDVTVVGNCHSAAEALRMIETGCVDLMFLDIRMPLFDGLALLRGLRTPPLTVIVSAYQNHALEGFDLDVVDYLVKPVSASRFAAALAKARRRIAEQPTSERADPVDIVLKVDRTLRRFRLVEISSFEAQGNFVNVVGTQGSTLATATLKSVRARLPGARFVQIHRSFIVNREQIAEQQPDRVRLADGQLIPIGRSYRGTRLLK